MAYIVVKTIWQSKEFSEAGDTPTGAEIQAQGSKEQLGKSSSIKDQLHLTRESPKLNLKRSFGCTNVSLLNLTDGEYDDSTTEIESTDDGTLSGGAGGERMDTLSSINPAWSEDDKDTSSQQQEVSNSGLVRAKDSVTSLKEKTSKVKCHVQDLQSECNVLCENLDWRRQEAEDLEESCSELKESCQKVTKSTEDAEVKTNALKKNSVLLEEKLRFLQQKLQAEDLSRQACEWEELEQRMATGVSKHFVEVAGSTVATSARPLCFDESELKRSTAAILASINSLRGALESGQLRAGLGDEGGLCSSDRKPTIVSTLAHVPLLDEIRKCMAELVGQSQQDALTQKEVLRLLAQLGVRLEEVLRQWERTHLEHGQALRMLREELDKVSAIYSLVNTEMLQQMVEHAVAPILEELKQRIPGTCPSCQSMQKKIMELEQLMLDSHVRAETLCLNVRLAKDEALRAKNYLERARINPEATVYSLDYLQYKLSSLHSQLSLASQEGAPQFPAASKAGAAALIKQSSCPAELNRDPQ